MNPARKVLLAISIKKKTVGRISRGLFSGNALAGAAKFNNLVGGATGYKLYKKIVS